MGRHYPKKGARRGCRPRPSSGGARPRPTCTHRTRRCWATNATVSASALLTDLEPGAVDVRPRGPVQLDVDQQILLFPRPRVPFPANAVVDATDLSALA
jgi:hypothetical protein